MSSVIVHEREQDDDDVERYSKRAKVEDSTSELVAVESKDDEFQHEIATATDGWDHVLPPSHALLGIPLPESKVGAPLNFLETDVGISEYIGRGDAKINGIIKQRFTDFLVYEVDLDGRVLHLKSLDKPESPKKAPPLEEAEPLPDSTESKDISAETPYVQPEASSLQGEPMEVVSDDTLNEAKNEEKVPTQTKPSVESNTGQGSSKDNGPLKENSSNEPWPEHFDSTLSSFLDAEKILEVKKMYLEGSVPPRVSDSGWGGRVGKTNPDGSEVEGSEPPSEPTEIVKGSGRDQGRRGRGRGRGGARGGRAGGAREDTRKVVSGPIVSKDERTNFHKTIRELFQGKLDTETDSTATNAEEGSRIAIKWARRGSGRGGRATRGTERAGGEGDRSVRGSYPPYIHFTLQKTNRDTQDALGHLSRSLHVNVKDLSVAGTKDKRGVTVQRVSLKRNNKTVEDVWKLANGLAGRRTVQDVLTQRGERGVRIADFNYRKASLELGMLKGNAFVITLRSVKVESMETLDEAMNTIKNKGFINYYGMQRFGTASVPTHSIGLAFLKSDWHKAVSLLLQKRPGEHPDVERARDAWLVEGDLDKALQIMPRRVVAERCILESYKKQGGDTRNAMGALSTIPRNLRLMYIHAYQSYVWNAIVSERIRTFGADKPVVGDLVIETPVDTSMDVDSEEVLLLDAKEEKDEDSKPQKRSRKPYVAPRIKTLTEEDLDKYSIFDVVMPLPGTDVAYPGGKLGERYREFLRLDGLDPDNFVRKQKDYTLNGSYRAILHLPKELSWSVLRYTDPDVPLAQADEDKLLGFDAPVVVEDGKFMALQINIQLGTAAYATMALREITKTETSSHFQSNLTVNSEDQKYRGGDGATVIADVEADSMT